MTVRIGDIAFDCDDAIKVATFWSGVLQRPLDTSTQRTVRSIFGTDGERHRHLVNPGPRCESTR